MLNDEHAILSTMRVAWFFPAHHENIFPAYTVCHGCVVSVDSGSLVPPIPPLLANYDQCLLGSDTESPVYGSDQSQMENS